MDLTGKHILVVGLARTGIAAARFLHRRGARVQATDRATAEQLSPEVQTLRDMGIPLELGGHRSESFTAAELIVVSPGVPHTIAPLAAARANGIPVIGEMELAARFIGEPIVAVTGTNGKTTVTELVGAMLTASGRRVFVGGNIGTPLIAHVDGGVPVEVVVAEVSSFQLDTSATFRPAVGVLLNITDDHLDRYAGFDAYAASKMRLFANQRPGDTAVLNAADAAVRGLAAGIRSRKLFFDRSESSEAHATVAGRTLVLRVPGCGNAALSLAGFRLRGPHNVENAAAASLAALAAGARPEGIQMALDTFAPAPHRLETIAVIDGVEYVNDSKATNVDAVLRGLECFGGRVVLIMGGVDKGGDFKRLRQAVRQRGRALVLLGGASNLIRAALGDLAPTREAASMRQAVGAAREMAAAGDAVLLAPGCASFDLYANYQERGDDFRREVLRLKESGEQRVTSNE